MDVLRGLLRIISPLPVSTTHQTDRVDRAFRLVERLDHGKNLDDLLEEWAVHAPGMWENDTGPEGWWAVSDDEGIKAYFGEESEAHRWRLAKINQALNG